MMRKYPRILAGIAFAALTATILTGCLVKQEDPPAPYYRTTDTMRIYKQGDWIRYNVIATIATSSGTEIKTGTIEVNWLEELTLTSPDNQNYDVIKKVITVNTDNSGVIAPVTTVHYVLSANTDRLVAMAHPNAGQYYWLNTAGGINDVVNGTPGGQEPVTLLTSPLVIGHTDDVDYYLMDECTPANAGCLSDVGRFTNTVTVDSDNTQINTNLNNYANPFKIVFNGGVLPAVAINQLPLYFDIFDVCSNAQSSHIGNMYIVPEVGIIQMSNRCTDLSSSGDVIQYDITIDTTSSSIQ